MAIVYSNYITSIKNSFFFFIRRIFRIWPLLWLCIFLAIAPSIIKSDSIISYRLLLENLTTIFGFVRPEMYINTGAWSIGNEMVYYSLTPFIIYFYNKNRNYGNIICAIAIAIYFSFFLMTPELNLAKQWPLYVNPLNNLFLYIAGIAIYYNLQHVKFKLFSLFCIFILIITVFIFYPVHGD